MEALSKYYLLFIRLSFTFHVRSRYLSKASVLLVFDIAHAYKDASKLLSPDPSEVRGIVSDPHGSAPFCFKSMCLC